MVTVTPIQMGVKFKPPSLILSYTSSADDHAKLRRRSMPIRGLGKNSDCYAEAEKMKSRHESYLSPLSTVRIEKFLRLLQETMKGRGVDEALEAIKMDFSINFDEDMNRLDDRQLRRRKELMDVNFHKNQVKVGDPDFEYDKQVDFGSGGEKVESGWDEEAGAGADGGGGDDFWG